MTMWTKPVTGSASRYGLADFRGDVRIFESASKHHLDDAASAGYESDGSRMTPEQRTELVASWLRLQRTSVAEGEQREDLSWVVVRVWDLCDHAPLIALQFISSVLEEDCSASCMTLLSAGPLEALLRRHGPRIIHRVERRARHDPRFAELLGFVWKSSLAENIGARVERAHQRAMRVGFLAER